MRTIGQVRILRLEEVPAFAEQLRRQPPLSPEEIERRRKAWTEVDKIVAEMEPNEEDAKEVIRRDWLRKAE